MITPEQIDDWLSEPTEHQRLEFKEAKIQFNNKDLYEYCVAIANEGGGFLILGVTDEEPRKVVGSQAFNNIVAMAEKLFNEIGFRVDIQEVTHPNGRVVVFDIPSRPHGTAYSFKGKYLMRSGQALVPMSEDRLRKIFNEGKPDWLEEFAINGLNSQDIIDLLDTQTFFDLLNLPYPSTREEVIKGLLGERLIDKTGQFYSIRRMGALLLAKKLSSFPELRIRAPRVIVYSGISKSRSRLDETGTKGYAVGFEGLVDFIMNQLQPNEIITDALREETKLLPKIAIRELTSNALIHQDFFVTGVGLLIEIFDNRVEISNPGIPIVETERFIDQCQVRSERLANLMRRMHICEQRSSGIDRVIEACELFQLPAPDFRVDINRTVVTIFGLIAFKGMDRENRVRACFQHCALKWVMRQPMTNQTLRERFHLTEDKSAITSQIIGMTVDAGLIKPDERFSKSRKHARYLPFWA